jgi:uronate dehydrogenase
MDPYKGLTDDQASVDRRRRQPRRHVAPRSAREGVARLYWEKHGIESVCLRIGSCLPRPTTFHHLSTWLGHEDLMHLIERAMDTPDLGFLVVWDVSNNTRSYWSNEGAERLGYRPVQNAEDDAEVSLPVLLEPVAQRYQGGSFASIDFVRPENRPR